MSQDFTNKLAGKAVKWLRKYVGNLTVDKFIIMLCCCGCVGFILDRVIEHSIPLNGAEAFGAIAIGGIVSAVLANIA